MEYIQHEIADCKDWEIKRKTWWSNYLDSNKEKECFHKNVSRTSGDFKNSSCPKCKQGSVEQRRFDKNSTEYHVCRIFDCPNFEEQSLCKNCEKIQKETEECGDCQAKLGVADESGNKVYKLTWTHGLVRYVCPKCAEKYKPKQGNAPDPHFPPPKTTEGQKDIPKEENKGLSKDYNYTPWLIGGAFMLIILAIIALAKSRD